MLRKLGYWLIAIGVLAMVLHLAGIRFPSLQWFFQGSETAGWVMTSLLVVGGLALIFLGPKDFQFSPQTVRQMQRFKSIRRGYWSLVILGLLVALALLDGLVVGKRAIAVHYDGKLFFPALVDPIPSTEFGGEGDGEPNYREMKERFAEEEGDNWVLLPPVPWNPTLDSDSEQRAFLVVDEEGMFHLEGQGELYSGLASIFYADDPTTKRQEWRFRRGQKDGPMEGWDRNGNRIENGIWKDGERVEYEVTDPDAFDAVAEDELTSLTVVRYPPVPPSFKDRHFLGTDTSGNDILAQLFGGWQILLQANVLYLLATYLVGITLGCAMGYFGGTFDIVVQRLIEVLSNIPFLYVVIIIASIIMRPSMPVLVGILCIFSWIGMTYYLRTATFKEKSRDYIAAARLMGAGTGRIIFRHILPNTISIVVTLLPFSVTAVIGSLTALDYLGFGLPVEYPSWGRLLAEGADNLSSPWIVSGAFFGTVLVLVLVTFVGEAIREAFDPKKFTTYK
ncbi:MAG: ABC transporter permease subunit [Verrucomicrobiales bacterium]|nr:ABC transporter permease subunit [Verrucomicrobiales bacterium]